MKQYFTILVMIFSVLSTMAIEDTDQTMLREDRVWEYFRYEYKENYAVCALDRFGFTGTMEREGITYQICKWLSVTTWRTPEGMPDDFAMAEDIEEEVVGLRLCALRQEGSKVYLFVDPALEGFHYSPAPYDINSISNVDPMLYHPGMLLFDFDAKKGDVVESVMRSYDDFLG